VVPSGLRGGRGISDARSGNDVVVGVARRWMVLFWMGWVGVKEMYSGVDIPTNEDETMPSEVLPRKDMSSRLGGAGLGVKAVELV
jgi:hypothetical protein